MIAKNKDLFPILSPYKMSEIDLLDETEEN